MNSRAPTLVLKTTFPVKKNTKSIVVEVATTRQVTLLAKLLTFFSIRKHLSTMNIPALI